MDIVQVTKSLKLQINGILVGYDSVGAVLPVVFVHGFPLGRRMWRSQLDSLGRNWRCVAIDLRGHGESDKPDAPMTIDLLADDVLSLISGLGLHPVVLVGHSMGGYVALSAYFRRPESFAGLVLVNTRAEADTPESRKARLETAKRVRERGGEAFRKDFASKLLSDRVGGRANALIAELMEMMNTVPDHVISHALEAMAWRTDSLPLLPEIRVPTLILAGADDKIIPLEAAQAMKSVIPRSKLIVIPNVGHLASLENPETFNSELEVFIRSVYLD